MTIQRNINGDYNGNHDSASVTRRVRISSQSMRSGSRESRVLGGTDDDSESSLKLRKRIVDIHGLSSYLKVCINTIYSWVSQGKIPSIKMGRLLRFNLDKIDAWIVARERNVNSEAA